jgi:hypothetical protein
MKVEDPAVNQGNPETKDEPDQQTEGSNEESEFKLTVRKLEMPVRPRGVLAE